MFDVEYDVAAAIHDAMAPGFVDPLLEDLTGLVLAIEHEFVGILRPIELSHLREDPELTEHALHAEGAALVRHDRNDALADRLVPQQRRQNAHERHRGRNFAVSGRLQLRAEGG